MVTKAYYTERPNSIKYMSLPSDDTADLWMRKNIESAETEDGIVYYADEAYMRITNGAPSQAEVIANFDEWYSTASAWQPPTPEKKPATQEERIAALTEELQALKIVLGVE